MTLLFFSNQKNLWFRETPKWPPSTRWMPRWRGSKRWRAADRAWNPFCRGSQTLNTLETPMAWSWPGEMGCVYSNQRAWKSWNSKLSFFCFLVTHKHWPDLARLNAILCDSCFIEFGVVDCWLECIQIWLKMLRWVEPSCVSSLCHTAIRPIHQKQTVMTVAVTVFKLSITQAWISRCQFSSLCPVLWPEMFE